MICRVKKDIFEIYLRNRNEKLEQLDTNALSSLSGGFPGAEIEQIIVNTPYTSAASEEKLWDFQLEDAIRNTNPTWVVMFDNVENLCQ